MLVSTTRASLTVDDAAAMRDQLNELREENAALKEALDEVRIQTNGQSFYFCSLARRPRSEGWPHHGRTFSIYLCLLSF